MPHWTYSRWFTVERQTCEYFNWGFLPTKNKSGNTWICRENGKYDVISVFYWKSTLVFVEQIKPQITCDLGSNICINSFS